MFTQTLQSTERDQFLYLEYSHSRFSKPNLEDVFLDLCLQDGDLETAKVREERTQRRSILKFSKKKSEAAKPDLENGQGCQMVVTNGKGPKPKEKVSATNSTASARSVSSTVSKYIDQKKSNLTSQRVTACMIKTFNRMKKRVGLLVYQFILPALQVSLFCLAIGQDPKELPVAVVNLENQGQPCAGHPTECPFDMTFIGPEINDNLQNLSCRYLSFMDASIARPVYYENYEDAHQAVKNGEAWGVISMGQNFSRNLYDRIFESVASEDLTKVNLDKFNASQIQVEMDITNQHIAFTLQLKFAEAFQQFMEQLVGGFRLRERLRLFQDCIALRELSVKPIRGFMSLSHKWAFFNVKTTIQEMFTKQNVFFFLLVSLYLKDSRETSLKYFFM